MAEFFAGRGNLSRCMRLSGVTTASLDLLYPAVPRKSSPNRHVLNAMDMNTPAGFAPFGCGRFSQFFSFSVFRCFNKIFARRYLFVCSGVAFVIIHGDIVAAASNPSGSIFLVRALMACGLGQICWVCWNHHSSWFECGTFDS